MSKRTPPASAQPARAQPPKNEQSTTNVDDTPDDFDTLDTASWVFTIVLAVVVGIGSYMLFLKLHDLGIDSSLQLDDLISADTGYSMMDPLHRRLQLYSEQAFYYSFYEDLVVADRFTEGFFSLFNEDRSEYPSYINAIERFNIYPEVVLAWLYRTFRAYAPSDQLEFMRHALMVLAGVQWSGFVVCASYLGGSVFSGLVAAAFQFAYYSASSRLSFHLTLRENFALPFLWWQILFVIAYVRREKPPRFVMGAIGASTVLFMLCWQFAQFILLLQCASLFGTYVLGFLSREKMLALLRLYLLTCATVITVTMGNTMLLTSMHFLLSISLTAILSLSKPSSMPGRVMQGVACLGLMAALKVGAGVVVEDDAHIFSILKAKLFNYEDFITYLYLCGPTYRAMSLSDTDQLWEAHLMPSALAAVAVVGVITVLHLFRRKPLDPSYPFVVFQAILFCALAATVRRLIIVAVPHLTLLAAMLASPALWDRLSRAVLRRPFRMAGVSLLVASVMLALVLQSRQSAVLIEDLREAYPNPRPDEATAKLMEFIANRTPREAIFSGDSVITSMIKLLTRRPVTFHPHTENREIRQRHHDFFQIYNRVPEQEVYDMLMKWGTDYVVISEGPCYLQCPEGQTMDYMANCSDSRGVKRNGRPELPQFCSIASTAKLSLFRVAYNSPPFVILKLKKAKALPAASPSP